MASPSELSLDCKPHGYSMLLKSFDDHVDLTQKLEEALALLEEERFKIDGLKRELPLCMLLLTNAVEVSRQQLQVYRANQGPRPVLEEFMPLKNSSSYNSENKSPNISDKANWMTTAQLWSQTGHNYETKPQNTITSPKETDVGFNVISPKLALDTKQGNNFFPFSKLRNSCPSPNLQALPDLTIASAEKEMDQDHKKCSGNENGRREILGSNNNNNKISNYNGGAHVIHEKVKGVGVSGNSTEWQTNSNNTSNNNNTQKKARRCWSPDLHRRFVNALQMLGGSQEIQASHKRAKSKSTSSRSSGTAAGGPRRHLGPIRIRHRSSSPQWPPYSISPTISTYITCASRLLHCSNTGTITTSTTSTSSPSTVALPQPNPRVQSHVTGRELTGI